jgi:hypothetical protein
MSTLRRKISSPWYVMKKIIFWSRFGFLLILFLHVFDLGFVLEGGH